MKKINLFFFIFLICLAVFPRDTVRLGGFVGYFSPSDQVFKDVYHGENIVYGAKLGIRVVNNLSLWVSVSQFQKDGETLSLGDATNLRLNPVNLTARYTIKLGFVNPYVGGGYSHIFYNEKSVIGNKTGEGKGYLLEGGLEFRLASVVMCDIGLQYSRCNVKSEDLDVQLGGIQLALGLFLVF